MRGINVIIIIIIIIKDGQTGYRSFQRRLFTVIVSALWQQQNDDHSDAMI